MQDQTHTPSPAIQGIMQMTMRAIKEQHASKSCRPVNHHYIHMLGEEYEDG